MNMPLQQPHLVSDLPAVRAMAALFDHLPDVVFAVKDLDSRYLALSEGCVHRCALRNRVQAEGRTAHELFPHAMANRYREQDSLLFAERLPLRNRLDLTVYPDGSPGWCLTSKQPLLHPDGRLLGLVCISKDLADLTRERLLDARFAACVDHIQAHYHRPLHLEELCDLSGLSIGQLDRRMKRVFQLCAGDFIRRTRMEAACHAIRHSRRPLADIAAGCGFSDQSALTRLCRQLLGLSPRQLRWQALAAQQT
ncbi:AraC family transcriptional regulator [Chromobacterium violaceum]|uniref:Regulatory protein soxS n=2 Tax=Chromobacterium violaceum TaxID=536 RepID=A0AAX2M5M6_CHRVL|nr:AraC family transcriptional regulator [Chromobacterium violaceum]MBP4045405.1 AraC family transcriptional regulator [Chromobacterium violaceum]MBP4048152.1 AraC family transcriptional regulator [Chromobacterium violaceum]MBT2867379.1 AraC family transcriptional regulator [Chromobacterium violaceum]STB71921.1 Regulatory protein soxS [Chromobacterium violaceum]SUX31610.1 Regulatory protein soxS [Chromobacterium violaceum]